MRSDGKLRQKANTQIHYFETFFVWCLNLLIIWDENSLSHPHVLVFRVESCNSARNANFGRETHVWPDISDRQSEIIFDVAPAPRVMGSKSKTIRDVPRSTLDRPEPTVPNLYLAILHCFLHFFQCRAVFGVKTSFPAPKFDRECHHTEKYFVFVFWLCLTTSVPNIVLSGVHVVQKRTQDFQHSQIPIRSNKHDIQLSDILNQRSEMRYLTKF